MEKLQNCWEVMKCGFGPNGDKAKTGEVCPVVQENRLDGVHSGLNGGRACWFVEDTFDCGKDAVEDFSNKYPTCMNCKFYWQVREEEGKHFEVNLLLHTCKIDDCQIILSNPAK